MISWFFVSQIAGSLARHGLTMAGGYLVGKGVLTQVGADQLLGLGMMLFGQLSSILDKAAPSA